MNKADLYLKNIELLKQVSLVMMRLGIEEDGEIEGDIPIMVISPLSGREFKSKRFEKIKTYRADSMKLVLPECTKLLLYRR